MVMAMVLNGDDDDDDDDDDDSTHTLFIHSMLKVPKADVIVSLTMKTRKHKR